MFSFSYGGDVGEFSAVLSVHGNTLQDILWGHCHRPQCVCHTALTDTQNIICISAAPSQCSNTA